ncbi:MAG: protein kinase, partial [Pirellula sp.]
ETFPINSTPINSTPINSTSLANAGQRKNYYESIVRMIHQAALALEHAHQYGIIHRDIKPGNLMVDQAGTVWVTDFGLAQVLHADTQLTRSGDHIGTLRYMSPEQAAGNREAIDHRTDIYSLGVTLYELLTLEPAIHGQDYREMLNQIAEKEPPTPKSVDPLLPTELDTIIRKAIAKEPSGRYASSKDFGDDLQRWLEHKPIAAKPPSIMERLAKWRKRNQRLVNLGAVAAVLSAVGLLITTLIVLREQQQTRIALQNETAQRAEAEANFQQARRAVDTFSELSESELSHLPVFQSLRRRILETSLDFYRDFLSKRTGDAEESQELQAATAKVERLVDELRLLDLVEPLLLLSRESVREELQLEPELGKTLSQEVEKLQSERESLGRDGGILLAGSNSPISELMHDFVSKVIEQIDSSQMQRLQQIVRQQNLPFTFLTAEVSDALELTADQRQNIHRIIREESPDRAKPPPDRPRGENPDRMPADRRPGFNDGRGTGPYGPDRASGRGDRGPGDRGPGDRGPGRRSRSDPGPEFPRREPDDRTGPPRPNPDRPPNGPWPNNEPGPFGPNMPRRGEPGFGPMRPFQIDPQFRKATNRIVERVLALFTEEQRTLWTLLIGKPFVDSPPPPE